MQKLRKLNDRERDRILKGVPYFNQRQPEEIYANDIYQVNVRRKIDSPFHNPSGEPVTLCHISIKRIDKKAKPDWRHFQWIKNEIVGEECEAVELYPKESRLVDGANQYHLWAFEDESMLWPLGFKHRMVTEKSAVPNVAQRKFPESRKPVDLGENEKKLVELNNKLREEHD